jgi:pantetheine-phosphate adenylyltransferase
MNAQQIAVYPGTFDPVTFGHTDLVGRASRVFGKVVVAIAESPHKAPLFSLEERIAMTERALADVGNVEVVGFDNLLMDFVQSLGATIIVRGLRAVSDFEYEFQLASMNRHLNEEVETLFMTPDEDFSFISSSLVKEIARLGGKVSEFVGPEVEAALRAKYADTDR